MPMYPSARGVRLPGPSAPPATRVSRATALFVAGFMAYWPIALACDSAGGGLGVQAMIGALTWLLLAAAIWYAPAGLRTPALAMVVVATAFECLGSLIWCAYRYRYHNLPLYVPPGHGLFYLAALRLCLLPRLRLLFCCSAACGSARRNLSAGMMPNRMLEPKVRSMAKARTATLR